MRCLKHDIDYAFQSWPKGPGGGQAVSVCPYCQMEEIAKMTAELATVTEQRDALLRAIDIKKLNMPLRKRTR